MEQNPPTIAKKFLKIVKVIYYILRKGISKGKLLHDLNMMMKRGKIAGKAAIHNLIFHHHHHGGSTSTTSGRHPSFPAPLNEYEFSCNSSPAFHLPFHLSKRKQSHPRQPTEEDLMAVEMFNIAAESPALPGFGPSPMVRQLRVTDSPFPLRDVEEDSHVDAAAEEFIIKFYKDLRQQNCVNYVGYY